MSKPFDATLKHLLDKYPADWLRLLGVSVTGNVEPFEAELSTVAFEADRVFRLTEPEPWLVHVELQSSYDAELPERVLVYNTLLGRRCGLPVQTIIVLLRPEADGPSMSGSYRRTLPSGRE